MSYTDWYEEKFADKRFASTRRDQTEEFHFGAKKKAETVALENQEARYLKKSNRCTTCFMVMPVGADECDCGGTRKVVKRFEPKDGRSVTVTHIDRT